MIKRILRFLTASVILICLITVVVINTRLYYSPEIEVLQNDTINADILKELSSLEYALSNRADVEMQRLYPEGYVFLNAIYGLSWCRFLESVSKSTPIFVNGHAEVSKAGKKLTLGKHDLHLIRSCR